MKANTYAYLLIVLTAARRALNDGETLKSIKENLFARLADVPQTFADLENLGSVDSSRCLTVYAALAEYSRKAPLSLHLDREIAFLQDASRDPEGMTAARLAELFRDWMNNFLSVERFAEHYGLTVAQAHDVIKRGKAHHDEAARQTSASAPALDEMNIDPQTPEEVIDAAQSILERFGITVNLRESAPEDPTDHDAAAVVHVATQALESWNDGSLNTHDAESAGAVITSWVENMQDLEVIELPADPYDLTALTREAQSNYNWMQKNQSILERETGRALEYLRNAEGCLMNVDHDRYPHARAAVNSITDAVGTLENAAPVATPAPRAYTSRQAALDSGDYDNYGALAGSILEKDIRTGHAVIKAPAPASTALTVICGTDTREWDDPVVMFIDAAAPEDVRAAVEAEYKRTLGDWAEDGGVILGIMRGHIQLGWSGYNGGNGITDDLITGAFDNYGVKP